MTVILPLSAISFNMNGMLGLKKVISIFCSTLMTMIISSVYYVLITKISPVIAQDYKNASIFFQDVNPRDVIYMINPLIIAISTFLLWVATHNNLIMIFKKKIMLIIVFSSLYALLITPVLLFNYASLKLSFLTIFGWFVQFYIQAFISGIIYSFFLNSRV